ncbi:NAD-dependent epimerase/dehydratase family protein [Salinimicrobium oceani]|uniref:NAD-dependent epimerase/dehydratase family protein n=1 Tax=Salinimicrobium oceani TaxID=2722702 RepID=A0ABX1D1K8_9FLAO|nr:NAD-dependent epimerase/dehydratase family protein [Salinimicrobium oceani]NJW53019.1 NAD-dependent epimerase/dehydratase family protein [Salinimicrobium oceani]
MILVTGGTGLVGSHLLLDLVKAGRKVRAIYRDPNSFGAVKKVFGYTHSQEEALLLFGKIEWLKADVNDVPKLEKAFANIEVVYHCAAMISFDSSRDTDLRKINIEGTANIINFCISKRVKKLCHVSSIATFDLKPGEKTISENSHWNKELNHSMYAITKYGAEMEAWRASQEGIDVVIVNPGVIIGPGFWNSGTGKIFKKVNSGLNYFFPKTTGFIGVWDVVRLMQTITESPVKNEQFILVSENLSFEEIFKVVANDLEKPAPSKRLKKWMIFSGWLWQEIAGVVSKREKKLDRRSQKSLFAHTFYSAEKAKQELNISFEPMREVIKRTAEAFKRDHKN